MFSKECSACKAKDQTILAMADQIDWLRMQLGTPWLQRRKADEKAPAFVVPDSLYESDDESDIRHMAENGMISAAAAAAALEHVGALSTEIEIS